MKEVLVEEKKHCAIITLNRPSKYNALNRETKLYLIKEIKRLNKTSSLSSIILTGEGKAFCSGQDLNDRMVNSKEDTPLNLGKVLQEEWNPLISAMNQSPKIIMTAINGVCAGAGMSVAINGDFIVSAPHIKWISGFAQIGLIPDAGASFSLVRHLGFQRTLAAFLLGKSLLSEDLLSAGLINEISQNPLNVCLEYADKISLLPPLAVSQIKKNLHHALELTKEETLKNEVALQHMLGNSQDYQEGVSAFLNKRTPQFTGQ